MVIGIDIGESKQKVKNFLERYPVGFSVLLDPEGKIAEEYNIVGIPTYVLIDVTGNIKLIDNVLPKNYSEVFK